MVDDGALRAQFRLLGPVEVWVGDRRIDVGQPRQRAVLAALLVDAGRVVPRETLIDRVWGPAVPEHARATLRTHLSRIRRLLEQAGECGVTGSGALARAWWVPAPDRRRPDRPAPVPPAGRHRRDSGWHSRSGRVAARGVGVVAGTAVGRHQRRVGRPDARDLEPRAGGRRGQVGAGGAGPGEPRAGAVQRGRTGQRQPAGRVAHRGAHAGAARGRTDQRGARSVRPDPPPPGRAAGHRSGARTTAAAPVPAARRSRGRRRRRARRGRGPGSFRRHRSCSPVGSWSWPNWTRSTTRPRW